VHRAQLVSAIVEAGTGVALIVAPSIVALLLLGTDLSGAAVAVGRVAGIALLSLALACWPGPAPVRSQQRALLFYNTLVALYLGYIGIEGQWHGPLLWPAAGLHAVLTVLSAVSLVRGGKGAEVTAN